MRLGKTWTPRFGRFIYSLTASTVRHDLGSLAAVISFYALFAMFPLLLLIIYGAGLLMPHQHIENLLLRALQPYYPALPMAKEFVQNSVENLSAVGERVGWISALTLVWSATSGFIAVQQAMDVVFEIREQRSFLSRRLVAFGMLILLLGAALVSSLTLTIYPAITYYFSRAQFLYPWLSFLGNVSRIVFPLSLFATCYIFYRFLPSRTTTATYALCGAFLATLGLDAARSLFVLYARYAVSYRLIYGGLFAGGLFAVMLLILWMYTASIVMLFGAEIAANLRLIFD